MTDYHKRLATDENWPAPKRNSVFYSMGQKERIERLSKSNWPDMNLDNQWIAFFENDSFDDQIAVDARSGILQKAFGVDEINEDDLQSLP